MKWSTIAGILSSVLTVSAQIQAQSGRSASASLDTSASSSIDTVGDLAFWNSVYDIKSRGFVGGIRKTEDGENVCTTVQIAPQYVLTANCQPTKKYNGEFDFLNPKKAYASDMNYVSLGTNTFAGVNRNGEIKKITQYARHPNYDTKTGEYNVFMFKMETPSKFTPVNLAAADSTTFVGLTGRAYGWITTATAGSLAETNLTFMSQDDCSKYQKTYKSTFCAKARGNLDAWRINNGSPLFRSLPNNLTLIGVAGIAANTEIGLDHSIRFNRVAKIRDWIKSFAGV